MNHVARTRVINTTIKNKDFIGGEEFEISIRLPEGWVKLEVGDVIKRGDFILSHGSMAFVSVEENTDGHTIGDKIEYNTWGVVAHKVSDKERELYDAYKDNEHDYALIKLPKSGKSNNYGNIDINSSKKTILRN